MYAQVIIPLGVKGTFTYKIPPEQESLAKPGMRVMVQFGKKKQYSGIIQDLHSQKPEHFDPKAVISFLDKAPLVNETQLQFWDWISSYYLSTIGEVMNAALPHGLKLQSDPDQKLVHSYKPKLRTCIDLNHVYLDEKKLSEAMDELKRAPAQLKALETYLYLSGKHEDLKKEARVFLQDLTAEDVTSATIKALIKKEILYQYTQTVSRIHADQEYIQLTDPSPLTDDQQRALKEIKKQFKQLPAVLLHGVTASGKTEVYIHMIQEQLNSGKQVLYLLPEIALTTQIISRLKQHFGDMIGIYHSRYSDAERVEVYRNMAGLSEEKPYQIILGVRSAVFLPFKDLGLIIVDEEHENTYKQFDPAPRYHARDAATILGLFTGASLILGTATPSFESLYNARTGKYGLVELRERYGKSSLPEIVIADVKQARKRKQLSSHFTPELFKAIEETLNNDEQIILFQNRRGYSNYLQCGDCGSILKCRNCDVSLTYHKYKNEMICHYCGLRMQVPHQCPDCHQSALSMRGFGTEKIEDELTIFFPDANVARLDLDNIRSRKGYVQLMDDFDSGKVQILVGTQLVTKGLDFERVSLVGILDADSMLNFPDFRAFERSYQLMTQVSGRAGRRDKMGKVVIQTQDPAHPVIQKVINGDYNTFFEEQIAERKMFKYPPIVRFIRITLRHEIPSILDGGANFLAGELREIFGNRILGPQHPPVNRTHGKYITQILMKIEKESSFERAKNLLAELVEIFSLNPIYKKIRLIVDVDPM